MQTSYNSVSINLNVLESVRKLNETFDGVTREWTECNRPDLCQPTKIFYSGSVCIQNTINLIPIILTVVKNQHTQIPTLNMGGRKLSLNVSTLAYNRNYGIPVRVGPP